MRIRNEKKELKELDAKGLFKLQIGSRSRLFFSSSSSSCSFGDFAEKVIILGGKVCVHEKGKVEREGGKSKGWHWR